MTRTAEENVSGRVLVWMPSTADATRTASVLRGAGVETAICAELGELCRALREGADGVVTTDDVLVRDATGQLAEVLRDEPTWSAIPFILAAREGAVERVQRSMSLLLRNVIVIERPVRTRSLLSVVLSALRGRRHQYEIRDALLDREREATASQRLSEALEISRGELARQAEQLRNDDRRKDEFLATLAHELRNPLAPIRTGLEVLRTATDVEVRRGTLDVMSRQLSHLVRLIDDLLDISRITRGKLELRCEPVTLGGVVESAIEVCRPRIDASKHVLRTEIAEPSLVLDVDPTRIAQVVANLLHNAAKYTPPGGHLSLRAGREGDEVVIEVRDDGIGIPAERLEEIFQMFSQVDAVIERAQGGLGIGLALVRRLVEMHGGSVCAASGGPGAGSTFRVRLPLRTATRSKASSARPPPLAPLARPGGRILVVDDNVDAADLLAIMLSEAGYTVTAVYDGESAITAVVDEAPQVVILDIGLPVMNGYDVAREIRRRTPRERLGLIALTGWGTAEDRRKAMDAGFDIHLTKPIDAAALHAALGQLGRKLGAPAAAAPPSAI